jgi:SAM-dependent methyltransferase
MKLPRSRPPVLANRRFRDHAAALEGRTLAETFSYIYDTNLWGADSRSGIGSELDATAGLRAALPELLRELNARVLLDIPCGDFGWLSEAILDIDEYIGADIVAAIVDGNQARYGNGQRRRFVQRDITTDQLPCADVVLCRDCLVHLSSADIFRAFDNLKRSGGRYLLTTTFVELESNTDIASGDWRPLNLRLPPFTLPAPLAVILEGCTEEGGAYADKALALWEIAALPTAVVRR